MDVKRQADLGIMFQEALRNSIGEQRYSAWFAGGVRFVFEGNVLTVLVDTPFMVDWIRSGYGRLLETVGQNLFGTRIVVNVTLNENAAANLNASRNSASGNYSARSRSYADVVEAEEDESEYLPRQEAPIQPKRKRGRPPKTPQTQSVAAIPPAFPQFSPFDEGDVYDDPTLYARVNGRPAPNADPYDQTAFEEPEPDLNAVLEPVKRKRGRPRKNPLPEQEPRPQASIPQKQDARRFVPQTTVRAAAIGPRSFVDEFNAAGEAYANANSGANQRYQNLSDAERVEWAVGGFDEEEAATERANPVAPARRGRPKGSTNKPRQSESPYLFNALESNDESAPQRTPMQARSQARPTPLFDEEENVSRDERGLSFVTRPKDAPRVKSSEDRAARFMTLRSFVEGYSNKLARQVVEVAIVEPSTINPLFIHGPSSVGKTHLLEGLCDAYARMPDRNPPLYMTSAQFTSAFIQSLRGGGAFRDRFKNISLFALDDLHFLEGKYSTQTELLNVVDFLRARRVQIAFSANRPLVELSKMRGELTTRIESGVVCKMEPPERETLAQILRQMALARRMIVGDDVCRYVVSRFATHARQLSGALNRLLAAHLATGRPIDLDLARESLADLAVANFRNIKLDDVERAVLEAFELDSDALKSSSRAKKCADPRAVAMWLARKHTRAALAEIGDYFGGRKHSAVLSAQKKVDDWLRSNESIDAGGAEIPASDAIERVERALGRAQA